LKVAITPLAALILGLSLFSTMSPVAHAAQPFSSSINVVIAGALPIAEYQLDLCSYIPFLGNCPIAFALSEHYAQPLSVQIQEATQILQPQMTETSQITVTPGSPNLVLDFNFSLGSKSYNYSVPLPALQAPGVFSETIPISQILANLVGLGLPSTLLGKLISLNVPVNLISSVVTEAVPTGFVASQQELVWNNPSTVFYNSTLTGTVDDSHIDLSSFRTVFSVSAQLVLSFPLIPPIKIFSFDKSLLNFGSSNSLPVGHWYQVAVTSPYSQPSGAGWYLSGSVATVSIRDQSVSSSGMIYTFADWTGAGPGSYSGSQISPSFTVNSPMQETANWKASTPQPTSSLVPAMSGIIVGAMATAVAGAAALAFIRWRRKP
jgi:hypothetical protein